MEKEKTCLERILRAGIVGLSVGIAGFSPLSAAGPHRTPLTKEPNKVISDLCEFDKGYEKHYLKSCYAGQIGGESVKMNYWVYRKAFFNPNTPGQWDFIKKPVIDLTVSKGDRTEILYQDLDCDLFVDSVSVGKSTDTMITYRKDTPYAEEVISEAQKQYTSYLTKIGYEKTEKARKAADLIKAAASKDADIIRGGAKPQEILIELKYARQKSEQRSERYSAVLEQMESYLGGHREYSPEEIEEMKRKLVWPGREEK